MSEILSNTPMSERQRRIVGTIQRSGHSLLSIINDILDFSKIEAGKMNIDVHEFEIISMIEDTAAMLAETAHKKGLELTTRVDKSLPNRLLGDSNRLRQILVNLAGNAIKFTESGEVNINVDLISMSETELCAKFSVRDTGIGISPEAKKRVFDAFSQADSSTTREYGGTGLGLAITNNLVSLMDGTLTLDSTLGKGSCFSFDIILGVAKTQTEDNLREPTQLVGTTILIVDDNHTNLDILCEQTKTLGMEVTTSSDPKLAFEIINERHVSGTDFDFILLDYRMPELDGIDLADQLANNIHPIKSKIILLSSAILAEDKHELSKTNFDCHLTKPVRQSELKATFEALASRRNIFSNHKKDLENEERKEQIDSFPDQYSAKILVAEDNEVNQTVASMMLEQFGCEVTIASNGKEAADTFQSKHFDIVLMDYHMPVMDGLQATSAIRQYEKSQNTTHPTPIIAVTANIEKNVISECRNVGMDDYLSKPFTENQLKKMLEQWTKQKQNTKPQRSEPANADNENPDTFLTSFLQPDAINSLRNLQRPNQPDVVKKFVTMFLKSSEKLMRNLSEGQKNDDYHAISVSAHTLKSSSANLGAVEFSRDCRALEELATNGNAHQIQSMCASIKKQYHTLKAALNEYIEKTEENEKT